MNSKDLWVKSYKADWRCWVCVVGGIGGVLWVVVYVVWWVIVAMVRGGGVAGLNNSPLVWFDWDGE